MSDFLLTTKTHIPPLRSHLVHRTHLIQQLNNGLEQKHRLILISAPTGYGKSTLLGEWVSQLDVPAAWLSLEKGENSPARFWSYFVSALHTIPSLRQSDLGRSILKAMGSRRPPPLDELLADLVNEFSLLEENAILVLDDLHTITENTINEGLVFLIEHLPVYANSLRLVVASRMDPPWPLARWRVRNELTEVRSKDLRFSTEEAQTFLDNVMEHKLANRDITLLEQRTDGWIAGLQIAAISLQGKMKTQGLSEVSRFIEAFTGSNRFILDYLLEEVINQQPTRLQDFLYATSILEQLTAPLCEALTGQTDCQAMLERAEQANLFLVPLDDDRQWYRYHHLFAELLYQRLKQAKPTYIVELHRRASQWYAANNLLSEAIRHALKGGDIQQVNELILGNAMAMVEHVELREVLRLFKEIPEQQLWSKPWLFMAYTWVKAYEDPTEELDQILHKAGEILAGEENTLVREGLQGQLDAVRAYVGWVRGEAEKALEYAQHALENLPEDDYMTRCQVLTTQGLAFQYLDRLPEAIQAIEAVVAASRETGRPFEILFANANLAFIYLLQGHLRKTFSLCQHTLRLADECSQDSSCVPVMANLYARMSMVLLEWNEIEPAVSFARESVALAERWNQADTLHFTLTCLSEALCAASDLEEAFEINHRAMDLALKVSPWFYRLSVCNEIWLNLAKGDIPAASRWIAEIEPLVDQPAKTGVYLVAKIALLYAQGNYPEVLALFEETESELERKGTYWSLMNSMPCQAITLQAVGREEEAKRVICRCLAFAAPEGYVRIFIKGGAPMARLLQVALHQGIETEYIHKLLNVLHSAAPPKTSKASMIQSQPSLLSTYLIEPLSDRELQVLRLLDSRLTNEEIGRELYVSVNTIRTHIRNIYSKLGVNRRGQAIDKSKELKLI